MNIRMKKQEMKMKPKENGISVKGKGISVKELGSKCIYCLAPLKKAKTRIRNVEVELSRCSKCGKGIFTEEQAAAAALKVDAHRLKKQYSKKLIRIGHSTGFTFPKELIDVFKINPSAEIILTPKLKENCIELKIS